VAHQLLKDIPHRAYLLSADTGEVRAELTPEEECMCQPVATAIAPDGSVVVAAFEYYTEEQGPSPLRGFLTVWSADDGTPKQTVDLGLKPMGVATDGRHAVVNGETGYAVVDLRTGTVSVTDLPPVLPRWEIPRPVKISRDGLRAAISRDNVVEVVSLPDGMQVTSRDVSAPDDHFEITAMTWSADGSVIVVGSLGGQLQFLDSDTLEPIAPPRLTVGGFVLNLTVSPDGTMLANTGTDGEARLWDTATWSPLGQPVVEAGDWTWAAFTSEGQKLSIYTEGTSRVAAELDADPEGTTGRVYTLPTDPDAWLEAACSIAGRELSQVEWDVIRPGEPWRPTCGEG
jgi:WD40 repeat protein